MTASSSEAKGRALIVEKALINGQWIAPGETFEVDNPSDETVLGTVPSLDAARVGGAIDSAAKGFAGWSHTKVQDRMKILAKWSALIEANEDGLGALISLENGKPHEEAVGEIRYANSFISWFGRHAEALTKGDVILTDAPARVLTSKDPVGPVAAITPWNFPAAMITRKLGAAFAAGCTVVLKPASATPFTALALTKLALEAGLPEDALHVVTGSSGVLGGVLTGSPLIRKLSFTGSTAVGRDLAAQCAPTLKKLSMELGGAAPLIVFADADIDQAVAGTIAGKFRASGQTCVCPNRIYVAAAIRDQFAEALTAAVKVLKVGKPFEPDVKIGPLIDAKGVAKVEDHLKRLTAGGAKVLCGGARHELGGRFFQPTVTLGGDDSLLCEEETFGPVAPLFSFDSDEAAIARANASPFGLAAYLFTQDLDRALWASSRIEAGILGVNTGMVSNAANPFGGIKQSGYGREGSVYGLDDYVQIKSVTIPLKAD
jgi:succinate-semialdehyde dehydrogenase/glutarate-semialdehyde dehydrogenase